MNNKESGLKSLYLRNNWNGEWKFRSIGVNSVKNLCIELEKLSWIEEDMIRKAYYLKKVEVQENHIYVKISTIQMLLNC